jgi:hypothetical protein
MPARPQDDKHDKAVEDIFPASDPLATSGIVGPKTDRHEDSRPKGSDDRHSHRDGAQSVGSGVVQ